MRTTILVWALGAPLALGATSVSTTDDEAADEALAEAAEAEQVAVIGLGLDLFLREWVPGDPRSAAGSGLGPDANDASCVACHSLGGPGGAGGRARNVGTAGDLENVFGGLQATMVPLELLRSGPLGGSGADFSARNPPALFGAGLLDQVPAQVLLDLAAVEHEDYPEISGRVSETDDGDVGRFAWKGHVASLGDFVVQACEVELDIVVPRTSEELDDADLSVAEVEALIAYVMDLPAPTEIPDQPLAAEGEAVFHQIGCSACHVESVGPATRVFSDLLLHDMGPQLSDAGLGYAQTASPELAAVAQEWRTPPLWGVRDSAPYLHDGRADTLSDAIAMHGGEATRVVQAWHALSDADRTALDAFLRSLTAPRG